MTKKSQGGFTLIELLVVVALIAVITPTAYSLLSSSISINKHIKNTNEEVSSLAVLLDWLEDDLQQIILESSRSSSGKFEEPLILKEGALTLSRTGWANPMGKQRSQLQRVEYTYASNVIERAYWDRFHRSVKSKQLIQKFSGATLSDIEVMSSSGDWYQQWPSSQNDEMSLPVAIRFKVTTNLGSVSRFFEINSSTKNRLESIQ